ncbi:MAG TPA: hypothetical protein VGB48_01925 [Allosphingosinicella sp.]
MEQDVLIFAVLTTGAVAIITQFARLLRSSMLHRTIRKAINNDSSAVPHLLAGIEEKSGPGSDDRTGLVLVAIGVAICLFGLIQGDADDIRNTASIAVFPLLVGAALIGRHLYAKRSRAQD